MQRLKKAVKAVFGTLCNGFYEALLRGRIWHLTKDMQLGKNVYIRAPLNVFHPENVSIGSDVCINSGLTVLAHDKVSIGDSTMIATNVSIITVNHDYEKVGRASYNAHKTAPVSIGKNAWLGANVTLLPGVVIGEGAVIGAGSVVTTDIPPYTVATGVPARVIKERLKNKD
ncbi:MAG: DapH/DapD/GlmU-related protein [Candidatus Omnitrophota bacterium]